MVKIIKVIDLFNKMVNGEDVPTEIKYKNSFYKWEQYNEKYWYYETGLVFYRALYFNDNILTDTVEIIEEQQDIDIQKIEEIKFHESDKEYLGFGVDLAHSKINELVQAVKQLDKNIKDKE